MARVVRALFVFQYRCRSGLRTERRCTWGERPVLRWDGGPDRFGRVHRPLWEDVARSCLEGGIDPATLIEAVFDEVDPDLPRPDDLLDVAARRRLDRYLAEAGELEWVDWSVRLRHLDTEAGYLEITRDVPFEEAARIVLSDPARGLSGLFRYCVAVQTGQHELVERYVRPALVRYVLARLAYDRGWGDKIPAELRAAADALVADLASKPPYAFPA